MFYLRPVGHYDNRQGKKYLYSEAQRKEDKEWCLAACERYRQRIDEGLAEEHARSLIPFDARQHFVMSCNVRSLMHLLDLRWKRDAQLEAQKLCELLYQHFENWCPEIAAWYTKNRAKKESEWGVSFPRKWGAKERKRRPQCLPQNVSPD